MTHSISDCKHRLINLGDQEKEGYIPPDGVAWFPASLFEGYLWGCEKAVYISFIMSKHPLQGNLSRLFEAIWATGRSIKVPSPLGRMLAILVKKGFVRQDEPECEVWIHHGNNRS